MAHDQEKEAAARASLRFVRDGDVVGLGSGSTAAYAVRFLGEQVRAGLKIRGIPTSRQTRELAASLGIPLTSFDAVQTIDVTIDGADEVDPQLQLIKGGGGALLHEKVVASASRRLVIVADSSKQVPMLGNVPLPLEVIAFAEALVQKKIEALGASVKLRGSNGKPFVTDEGHHILDCSFGQIPDPTALARVLSDMPGVVEHGLFINMASVVLIAKGPKVIELTRPLRRTALGKPASWPYAKSLRWTVPPRPSKPAPRSSRVPGSGVVTAASSKSTLSRPFELSVTGSRLSNSKVVMEPAAVKGIVNCSHVKVLPGVLLVSEATVTPLILTPTVLVLPQIDPEIFPTQKDRS